jgi:hypothetical protein
MVRDIGIIMKIEVVLKIEKVLPESSLIALFRYL